MPKHYPDTQRLQIAFTVPHRRKCTVDIIVEPDMDPILHGQNLTNAWPDLNAVLGYPILKATVMSPTSRTYASLYGWIQLTKPIQEPWTVDVFPQFQDVNSPFVSWGAEPTLVDALAQTERKYHDWRVRAFLCYSPDAAMTKTVVPVLGVEWGYWVDAGVPYIKKVWEMETVMWNDHVKMLREQFNGWTFKPVTNYHLD